MAKLHSSRSRSPRFQRLRSSYLFLKHYHLTTDLELVVLREVKVVRSVMQRPAEVKLQSCLEKLTAVG